MLGVGPASDAATVRQAYVALARQHHPDRPGGDAARMRAINDAWSVLGDPLRRTRYDRALAGADAGPAPSPGGAEAADARPASDLQDDLEDDRPIHAGTVRLPRWLGLVPPALFCAAVAGVVVGLIMSAPALLGLAMVAFVLSCLFFLAAPFVALFVARTGAGRSQARR